MQTILTESDSRTGHNACRRLAPNLSSATLSPAVDDAIEELPTSRGFAALLASYRASGGTARGDDVARLLEDHGLHRSFRSRTDRHNCDKACSRLAELPPHRLRPGAHVPSRTRRLTGHEAARYGGKCDV